MLNLLCSSGQGPPLLWYLIVVLSLMAALTLGQVTTAGFKTPAPEFFNFQVADLRQKEHSPSYVNWRST